MPADFPPYRTIYDTMAGWQASGATEAIHGELREQCRIAAGRKPQPTVAVIDSQSVKAAEEVARPSRPRPLDLLLDGFALLIAEGHAAAAPTLQRAVLARRVPVTALASHGRVARTVPATRPAGNPRTPGPDIQPLGGSVMTAHWPVPAGLRTASARLPVEGELPSFGGATGGSTRRR